MGDFMFYRHVVLQEQGQEVLYLYLTNTYEFAQDLKSSQLPKNESITNRVENYIKNRGIKFHGNKVYLVVDGIIVGSLDLKEEGKYREIIDEYLPDYEKVRANPDERYQVLLEYEDAKVEKMSLYDYLLGALSSTIMPTFHLEALKAQAIICRSYALKKMSEEHKIKAKNDKQIYHAPIYYKFVWGQDYFTYRSKIETAIRETNGQFLAYQNQIIEPFYHVVSNGRTERAKDSKKFPYLQSVSSVWDIKAPTYKKTIRKTFDEIALRLGLSRAEINHIQILNINSSNRIEKVRVGSKTFTGKELMYLLGLPSTDVSFVIEPSTKSVRFITRGRGDGLGLSQYGANGMAEAGYLYGQILYHYFPNTSLRRIVLNNQ